MIFREKTLCGEGILRAFQQLSNPAGVGQLALERGI
jgi:hypothetical protein